MKIAIVAALVVTPAFAFMNAAHCQSTDVNARVTSGTPADNTKTNQQDRKAMHASADDQKNDTSDLTITREIRRSVMADKTLSTYAHNAKIVAVNGIVTLNGVVRTEAEKTNLTEKAAQVVGPEHVVNDLKVKEAK